jgi:hypothetical protein
LVDRAALLLVNIVHRERFFAGAIPMIRPRP